MVQELGVHYFSQCIMGYINVNKEGRAILTQHSETPYKMSYALVSALFKEFGWHGTHLKFYPASVLGSGTHLLDVFNTFLWEPTPKDN